MLLLLFNNTRALAGAVLGQSDTSAQLAALRSVVGEEMVLVCGSTDPGSYPGLTAAEAVCPGRRVSCIPPVILGPNSAMTVYAWFPGNATTGLSFELEMGWWER